MLFLDYLTNNYPNIGRIKSSKKISHVDINSKNYLISTDRGKFVLRNYSDGSDYQKINKMCKILSICTKKRIKVYEPIRNKNKKYVDSKKKVFLTEYYSGDKFSGSESEIKDAAKNLAILHKGLKTINISYNFLPNNSFYKIFTRENLKKMRININKIQKKDSFDNIVLRNFDLLEKFVNNYEKNSRKIMNQNFKKQLIHFDYHPQNVIFKNRKVSAIIDFNSMRRGLKIHDISFGSFRFALSEKPNIKNIRKRINLFLNSYLIYDQIDEKELRFFNDFLIKIFLSRICFILKKRYYSNSNLWTIDFEKNLNFLKIANKL